MMSDEKEKLRAAVSCNASLSRVFGMIRAYLEGKKNCTDNWIDGQITKAHNKEEARMVLAAYDEELSVINGEKLNQLRNRLGISQMDKTE